MLKNELITYKDPKSPISEIFRTLRTNLQFMNVDGNLKTVLITSTLPGEGKSLVSANLAVAFAQADKKVLLIDADMRKGMQYVILGVSPTPGLSNYLSGMHSKKYDLGNDVFEYIQEADVENLYVLTAGNVPPNPSELLNSKKMMKMIDELKESFDIIIIDGTPCQLVTDSLILTTIVDTTILVTAYKQTKKEELRRVLKSIKNVGGKVSGVIVNKMPISAKKYEQSYYYGSTSMEVVKSKPRSKKNRKEVSVENRINRHNAEEIRKKVNVYNEFTTEKPKKKIDVEIKNENDKETSDEIINKLNFNNEEKQTLDKTNDILKQLNDYLEDEKQKLSANNLNTKNINDDDFYQL